MSEKLCNLNNGLSELSVLDPINNIYRLIYTIYIVFFPLLNPFEVQQY